MNDQFIADVPLLNEKELPGNEAWNSLIRFIRGIRSASPFLSFGNRRPEGCTVDLDVQGILDLIQDTGISFRASIGWEEQDNQLRDAPMVDISAGNVRLPDKVLPVKSIQERCKLDEKTRVWLRITQTAARILISSNDFPPLLDAERSRINWPICEVSKVEDPENAGTTSAMASSPWKITVLHQGDVNIVSIPPFWIQGYSGTDDKARVISHGTEQYADIGNCDEDEQP